METCTGVDANVFGCVLEWMCECERGCIQIFFLLTVTRAGQGRKKIIKEEKYPLSAAP